MHFAIIAAGEGIRLREEGIALPKPLVPVDGVPMLGRLIDLFVRMDAESISVICNESSPEVAEYLSARCCSVPGLRFIVQSTSSSMHSLAALSQILPEGRFCLTTVDTIFQESSFRTYVHACETGDADGLFVVTPYVDDEKPLWVEVDSDSGNTICGFYDQESDFSAHAQHLVSGGVYCLDTRTAMPVLQECLKQGQSRMRNYQRALLAAGLQIKACIFPKVMDIDHAEDIRKAEKWLKEG